MIMEDNDLKNIWNTYEREIANAKLLNMQSWSLNVQWFEQMQQQKAAKKLSSLKSIKWIAVILGISWTLFLAFLIINSLEWSKIFFLSSAIPIMLCTAIAVVVYIKHIVLINDVNNSETLISTQEKLTQLQSSTLQITRVLFLQMPFYCFWFVTPQMIASSPLGFWGVTFPITLVFTWLSLWLYRNIKLENVNKKWFKTLFNSPEWTSIIKAKSFMDDVEQFKKDNAFVVQ